MADFKTAEQYVVEQLELKEAELTKLRTWHEMEMERNRKEMEAIRAELIEVYDALAFLRNNITLGNSHILGQHISIDEIYRKDNPDAFDDLLELLCISVPNTEEDNEDA